MNIREYFNSGEILQYQTCLWFSQSFMELLTLWAYKLATQSLFRFLFPWMLCRLRLHNTDTFVLILPLDHGLCTCKFGYYLASEPKFMLTSSPVLALKSFTPVSLSFLVTSAYSYHTQFSRFITLAFLLFVSFNYYYLEGFADVKGMSR